MGSLEWDEISDQIWSHYDAGEVDKAIEIATRRIALFPNEPSAYKTRAALNFKRDPDARR